MPADETVTQEFDPKAYFASRNATESAAKNGKVLDKPAPVAEEKKPEAKAAEPKPEGGEEHESKKDSSRSWRRQLNRVAREAADAKAAAARAEGELEAYKRLGVKPASKEVEDPEPKRDDFSTDAEYQRAVHRWDTRQEVKTATTAKDTQDEGVKKLNAQIKTANELYASDVELFKAEFDAAQKESDDNEDTPEFTLEEHPGLVALLATSDVQMALTMYLMKHPDQMQKLLDLTTEDPTEQVQLFRRLEGRAERMYDRDTKKAAQAAKVDPAKEEPKKDRKDPAEAAQAAGRNASESDSRKPRPTAEVAARGGSAPPDEPKIGSPEWMAKRNAAQFTARY